MWLMRRSIPVLSGVDLTPNTGEVVGLVGENGSAKSTLVKVLVGALRPDAGTVMHSGRHGGLTASFDRPGALLAWAG